MISENRTQQIDFYISVDVETAGPYPGAYSLLSIGACTMDVPPRTFYVELQPVNDKITDDALAIHGLDLQALLEDGLPATEALDRFSRWIQEVTPPGKRPVFVAFNAPFDWMFVNYYFHYYCGLNPFGHSALDIKVFYMGVHGIPWSQTGYQALSDHYLAGRRLSHNALDDAQNQADIFQHVLQEIIRDPRS